MSGRPGRWMTDLPTRLHLVRAERRLRRVDTSGSSPGLRLARRENLDRLRAYRRAREFPRNTVSRTASPCFVDPDGRLCAVGALVAASGDTATVRRVAGSSNHARLLDMDHPGLDVWAASAGLSKRELARIQPSYPPEWVSWVPAIFVLWVVNVVAMIANLVPLAPHRRPFRVAAWIGVVLGSLLVIAGLCVTTLHLLGDTGKSLSPAVVAGTGDSGSDYTDDVRVLVVAGWCLVWGGGGIALALRRLRRHILAY